MDARLQMYLGLDDLAGLAASAWPRWRSGLPYFVARALGFEAGQVTSVTHEYGNTFTAVGGCSTSCVILDAYDTALGRKP